MRNLFRRLVSRREKPRPPRETPRARSPLRPWQIRERCFNTRRHGLDPVEIHDFLHRVADELTVAQTTLVAVQEENIRIKNALRAWQSVQAGQRQYQ